MLVKRVDGATRSFGAPSDWVDDGMTCMGLPVREVNTTQGMFYVSAWEPTPEEIDMMIKGETIKLWIRGPGHPVVSLTVGPVEDL